MYQIIYIYDDYGDREVDYKLVATEEEAKQFCDYANLHGYMSEARVDWWDYVELPTHVDTNVLENVRKECHNIERIKERIKYFEDEIEALTQWECPENELWIEEYKRNLVLLQAELAELECEVK